MQCPAAVIFDLDDTLAESFRTPSPEILDGLQNLLERMPVAIMTGTGFQRMEDRFLPVLAAHPRSDRLYIFPTSSAQAYVHESGAWKQLYDLALTENERARIKAVVIETVNGTEGLKGVSHYGEQLVDRGAQILYVGDALYPGGNDAVVIPTGIPTRSVSGPAETEKIIDELIAACR